MSTMLICMDIPVFVKEIIVLVNNAGFEIHLVGGCVRDYIMGCDTKDWDLISNARVEILKDIFQHKKDIKIVDTGVSFGSISLYYSMYESSVEITTYRCEGNYHDYRKPSSVEFVSDVRLDLVRRDFSINALICNRANFTWSIDSTSNMLYHKVIRRYSKSRPINNPISWLHKDIYESIRPMIPSYTSKESSCAITYVATPMILSDYVDAIHDIQEKRLICIGLAYKRFCEDSLRIMRAMRFMATLACGFSLDSNTRVASFMLSRNVATLKAPRIYSELSRIVLGEYAGDVLLAYRNIFIHIIPLLDSIYLKKFYYNCKAISYTPKVLELRVALLFDKENIQEDYIQQCKRALEDLVFSRLSINRIISILTLKRLAMANKSNIQWLLSSYDSIDILYRLLANASLSLAGQKEVGNAIDRIKDFIDILRSKTCYKLSHLAINGNDIKLAMDKLGITRYNKIGEILEYLLYQVVYNRCDNTKDSLYAILETRLMRLSP